MDRVSAIETKVHPQKHSEQARTKLPAVEGQPAQKAFLVRLARLRNAPHEALQWLAGRRHTTEKDFKVDFLTASVSLLMAKRDEPGVKEAVDFVLTIFERYKETEFMRRSLDRIIRGVVQCGNKDQVGKIFSLVRDGLSIPQQQEQAQVGLLTFLLQEINTESKNEAHELLRERFNALGLNFDDIFEAWRQSDISDKPPFIKPTKIYEKNLRALFALEHARPGITKALVEEFGVKDFARYPKQMLIAQYDQRNNSQLPYGVVLYPRADHSSTFYHDVAMFNQFFNRLGGRYAVRIHEISTLHDLVHTLNTARHRFGQASFAIIGGHGSDCTIDFGEEALAKIHTLGKPAQSLRLAFKPTPPIVLVSCSTGIKGGIGDYIRRIGADVIAPTQDTSIELITPHMTKQGKIAFSVRYAEGEARRYKPKRF